MSSTPFPQITPQAIDAWQWPRPPFAWRHTAAVGDGGQRCRIETRNGAAVEGDLLGIDPPAGVLRLRLSADGAPVSLPFARFSRLTLLEPLTPAARRAGAPIERVPAAAQERDYRVQLRETGAWIEGRTLGHVETADALFLFVPIDQERAVQRVMLPRSAYTRCEFGVSAGELAARHWIATPEALLQALAEQQNRPVQPLGQSLLELGLLTAVQLQRVLDEPAQGAPLGERLVASGLLSRGDLQTALAHKMGYPCVDVDRFPVDLAAVQKLPHKAAVSARALPLMIDGTRLIVAVDRPARLVKLQGLQGFAQLTIVPVLASKPLILLALGRLAKGDVWAANEFGLPGYFATTT